MTFSTDKKMKQCPFCGQHPDITDPDCVHPVTRLDKNGKQVWRAGCVECAGGCGAEVTGWSAAEAIDGWNRRI